MSRKYILAGKILFIVLFSLGMTFCFLNKFYFTGTLAGLLLIGVAISVYKDQQKIIRKMESMIAHIHYDDLSISFPDKDKGEEGNLSRAMNEALAAFRSRLYNSVVAETEISAWQKLIRVLTHEIMNSVTPIISLSETITDRATLNGMNEHDYEIMLQAMQTIHRRGKGLLEFVENYRKLTRIPLPEVSSFCVSDLFETLRSLLPGKADITFEIHPPDLLLKADRSLLEQMLLNLVKNSMESTATGKQPVICITAGRKEGRPFIAVADCGVGIVPEALDKVFVPFYTTKTGGSGIGLSICRQIMNRHGGTVTIQSQLDKGTTVALVFPSDRVEPLLKT